MLVINHQAEREEDAKNVKIIVTNYFNRRHWYWLFFSIQGATMGTGHSF